MTHIVCIYNIILFAQNEGGGAGEGFIKCTRVRSATNWISCIRVCYVFWYLYQKVLNLPIQSFDNTIIITHKCIYWKIWVPSSISVKRIVNTLLITAQLSSQNTFLKVHKVNITSRYIYWLFHCISISKEVYDVNKVT